MSLSDISGRGFRSRGISAYLLGSLLHCVSGGRDDGVLQRKEKMEEEYVCVCVGGLKGCVKS